MRVLVFAAAGFIRGYRVEELLAANYEVIGPGRLKGGPLPKQFLSRMAGLNLHWFRGIPVHDATNAFKIYDRDMLRSFTVPSTWKDRTEGTSRFRLWQWLRSYLRWYFTRSTPGIVPKLPERPPKQALRSDYRWASDRAGRFVVYRMAAPTGLKRLRCGIQT